MPEKRKITPIQSSPTSAPSPSNTNLEVKNQQLKIEDTEDQESFESAGSSSYTSSTHTVQRNIMSSIIPSTLTQRQYAVTINTSLNKISVTVKLNKKNFITWSQSIVRAVRSIGLNPYLKDDIQPDDFAQAEHLATLECLTNWLLNQMEPTLATRIESDLEIPGSADLEIEFSPSKVWNIT